MGITNTPKNKTIAQNIYIKKRGNNSYETHN